MQCCLLPSALQVSAREPGQASHQALSSWACTKVGTWEACSGASLYSIPGDTDTQPLCHREPCNEALALVAPPQRHVRESGGSGWISERSEMMVVRQSPYSLVESEPRLSLQVSEEQVPPSGNIAGVSRVIHLEPKSSD